MESPPSDLVNRPKARTEHSPKTIAMWALTMLTALLFIAAAVPKLGGFGFFEQAFDAWGYPDWFEMGVGIIEFVGAIFLIIPATAFYAACVLGLVMVGAILTHLFLGAALNAIFPFVVLCILVFIGLKRRSRAAATTQPEPSSAE